MAKNKENKTIDVETFIKIANTNLARRDTRADSNYKMDICNFVENVLMESGNYNDYLFITKNGRMGYFSKK